LGCLARHGKELREESAILRGGRSLLSMNQPDGFDCPGSAWPDPKHTSSFEFCENGAKAVAWETTKKRVTREFFATWTVGELERQSDHWLEDQGRLTEPMRYDPATDKYVPVSWDAAFALIGQELRALTDPNEAEFYTSGHEPTSVGLPESIGIGKGIERCQIDPEAGFAVITSRCSFEMVQKAATIRMPILVAISAPTTMALRIAEQTGITLVALARSDSITVYANPGRIRGLVAGLDDG
jgi:hypothetical protein